jgi:lipopolysaccharide transport system permease protein
MIHPTSPRELILSIWRNRELLVAMTRREIVGRYRGSLFGIIWSLFHPLFMLGIYTFVFGIVLRSRWGAASGSTTEFALVLFIGLIVFNFFAECVNRAPRLVVDNANFVKKVVFPLEILPLVLLGSSLFHAAVSLIVWLLAYSALVRVPGPEALLLPLVFLPLAMLTVGITWALASLGVFLRDISQVVGILTPALMFLSPVFYPVTALPEEFRPLLMANPLTTAMEQARSILVWSRALDTMPLALFWAGSLLAAWLGFAWFQKTRKGFGDVL